MDLASPTTSSQALRPVTVTGVSPDEDSLVPSENSGLSQWLSATPETRSQSGPAEPFPES